MHFYFFFSIFRAQIFHIYSIIFAKYLIVCRLDGLVVPVAKVPAICAFPYDRNRLDRCWPPAHLHFQEAAARAGRRFFIRLRLNNWRKLNFWDDWLRLTPAGLACRALFGLLHRPQARETRDGAHVPLQGQERPLWLRYSTCHPLMAMNT